MSVQLLTLLKFCLLALIYLFFFRVLRAVWAEITPPKVVAAPVARARAPKPGKPAKGASAPAARASRPSRPEPTGNLVVLEPAELRGRTYSLGGEITVGRAPGCSVMVDDTFVSQVHARVFQREGNYLVEDLGSTNGTYLNKKKLSGTMMMHRGDRLQVGNTVLELE